MDPGLPIRGRRRWSLRFASLFAGLTLLIVIPTTGASALSKPGCAGWHYDNLSRQANSLATLLGPYVFNNTTSHDATFSLSRTLSGTVALSVSVSVSATADFFVGKIESTYNVNVSSSYTASSTLTGTTIVPSHYSGYLAFGVYRVVTTGWLTYRDGLCKVLHDYGSVKVQAPAYEGFKAWEEPL
jgi:hypothetical protein